MFRFCAECGGEKPKHGTLKYKGKLCVDCDNFKKRTEYREARGGVIRQPPATIGPKLCSKCKQLKPQESFYLDKDRGTRNSSCRSCRSLRHTDKDRIRNTETMRIWRINNPGKSKSNHMKAKYGIDSVQYDKILSEQNGLCAICAEVRKKMCVDHCHKTGIVRGILCGRCNTAIGMLGDDPYTVDIAASYLRKFSPVDVLTKQIGESF